MKRYATVNAPPETAAAYLPSNYKVIGEGPDGTLLAGEDKHGWTLEDYVIPRFASGLYVCKEFVEDPGYPYNLEDCPRCSGKHDGWDDCYDG